MPVRPGGYQTNFNAGEVDPAVQRRVDIKSYYAGVSLMQNAEPRPQGGFTRAAGTRDIGRAGRRMTAAGSATPSPIAGVTTPQLLVEIDLGATVAVAGVDLAGLLAGAALAGAITVNVSAVAGVDGPIIGAALDITTSAQTRRLAFPPGQPVSGRYLRLRTAAGFASATTVTPGTVTALVESYGTAARLEALGGTDATPYRLILCEGHVDIWNGRVFAGACAVPHTAAQLAGAQAESKFDTLFLFHADVAPWRIVRVYQPGSTVGHQWRSEAAPFVNVPRVDFGGTYTNGVAEQWIAYLSYTGTIAGQSFNLVISGETTDTIEVAAGPDWAATATAIAAAINALDSIVAGVTVAATPKTGVTEFLITFGGAHIGKGFTVAGTVLSTADAALTASVKRRGVEAGEAVMSVERGWPRAGRFFSDRLFIGGFRTRPSAYAASQLGEYFQLSSAIETVAGPFLDNIDAEGGEKIVAFSRNRFLQILTNRGNYFITNRAITRSEPRNVARSTTEGAAEGVPVVDTNAGTVFLSESRTVLHIARYDEALQSYAVEPLSLLASHLIDGIRDMTRQGATASTDAERLWMPRDDGLMVLGALIRNQDITAFARRTTDGAFLAGRTDAAGTVFTVARRRVAGVDQLRLEELDADLLFDQTVERSGAPTTTITGLAALEGATVWAEADGYTLGPFTVTGAAITLDEPAATVAVGRWTPTRVVTMPQVTMVADQLRLPRPMRVHAVTVYLRDTQSLAVGANDDAVEDVPFNRFGLPTDVPVPPFTGEKRIDGLTGWSLDGLVELTQLRPGRLTVESLTVETRT